MWLKLREDVRGRLSAVYPAVHRTLLKCTPPLFPDPDPDAVETEVVSTTEIDASIDAFTTAESSYGVTGTSVDRIDPLKPNLKTIPGVQGETDIDLLGGAGSVD